MTDPETPKFPSSQTEKVDEKKAKAFRKLIDRACTLMPKTPEPQQGWVVIVPYASAIAPEKCGVHVSARLTNPAYLGLVFEGLVTQMLRSGIHPKQMADSLTKAVMEQIQREKDGKKVKTSGIIIPGNFGKIPS